MKKVSLIILIFIHFYGVAQVSSINNNLYPNLKTQSFSPNLLGGNIVDKYTGKLNLNIPITSLKAGGNINVPISLNFNKGGIKVSELSSWVGLGWQLLAGGQITKEVRGIDDETSVFGRYAQSTTFISDLNSLSSTATNNEFNFFNNKLNDIGSATPNATNNYGRQYDNKVDYFHCSVNGNYVKFYISDNGNPIFLIGPKETKVLHPIGPNATSANWEISFGDGIKYTFNNTSNYWEKSAQHGYYNSTNQFNYPEVILKWNLSKITSAWDKNEEVTFEYYSYQNYSETTSLVTRLIEENQEAINYNEISDLYTNNNYTPIFTSIQTVLDSSHRKPRTVYFAPKFIKEISSKNFKLKFVESTQTREDIYYTNASQNNPLKLLEFIEHYKKQNSGGADILLEKFNLVTNYFPTNRNSVYAKRIRLKSINKVVNGNNVLLADIKYHTDYTMPHRHPISYNLNPGTSYNGGNYTDFWGYFNKENEQDCPYSDIPNTFFGPNMNRPPRLAAAKTYMPEKIIFASGGATEIEYELNTAYSAFAGQKINVGGLRVKKVIHTDGVNSSKNITREYVYEDITSGSSYGVIPSNNLRDNYSTVFYETEIESDLHDLATRGIPPDPNIPDPMPNENGNYKIYIKKYRLWYNHPNHSFDHANGYHIGYSKVVEKVTGKGSTESNFYTENDFTINYENPELTQTRKYPGSSYNGVKRKNKDFSNQYGFPKSEILYDNSGVKTQEVVYSYENNDVRFIEQAESSYSIIKNDNLVPTVIDYTDGSVASVSPLKVHFLSFYETETVWKYLKSIVTTNYEGGNSISSTTNFTYNNPPLNQVTKSTTTLGNGDVIENETIYANSFSNLPSTSYPKVLSDNTNYIVNLPVYTTSKLNGKFTNASLSVFEITNDLIYPKTVYQLETNSPVNNLVSPNTNGFLEPYPDKSMVRSSLVKEIDENGTPLTVLNKNNIPSGVFLEDNGLDKIAEFSNAYHSEVCFTGFENDDFTDNFSTENVSYKTNSEAKFGEYSYELSGSSNFSKTVKPHYQDGKMTFSVWIKTNTNYTSNVSAIHLFSKESFTSNSHYPNTTNGTEIKTIQIPNTNGDWKLFKLEIDLGEIREYSTINPLGELHVEVLIENQDANEIFLDDFRFYPSHAFVSTNSVNSRFQLTDKIGENSISSSFEYDDYDRQHIVKDHEGNIRAIKEFNIINQ